VEGALRLRRDPRRRSQGRPSFGGLAELAAQWAHDTAIRCPRPCSGLGHRIADSLRPCRRSAHQWNVCARPAGWT